MSAPDQYAPQATPSSRTSLMRAAIWVAIGALIAAALVCVVWVLVGTQNGIVGRAFLTILLLAAFAGVAILDAHLADRRPGWFALASMATWVVTLLIGAVLIWLPERSSWIGVNRFVQFLLIVLILQLALLHVRLYSNAFQRHITAFTQTVFIVTIAMVIALAALLVVPLVLSEWVFFADFYWRVVIAVAILAAVGTALLPLVNLLFAPKKQRPQQVPYAAAAPNAPQLQQWPTYVDGFTPLPVMPDGSPDWNAYYTGYPTHVAPPAVHAPPPRNDQIQPPAPSRVPASASPADYDGFRPPPPLPPRP